MTRDQVFKIAAELEADGKKPTQKAVREALGGGSFSTINGFLTEYRIHKENVDVLQAMHVPQKLMDEAKVFVASFWQAANDYAQTENVALKERIATLESEIFDMRLEHHDALEVLESEHAADTKALKNFHEAEIKELNEAIETSQALSEASEKAIADQDKVIERLKVENARLTGELEAVGNVQKLIQAALKDKK